MRSTGLLISLIRVLGSLNTLKSSQASSVIDDTGTSAECFNTSGDELQYSNVLASHLSVFCVSRCEKGRCEKGRVGKCIEAHVMLSQ